MSDCSQIWSVLIGGALTLAGGALTQGVAIYLSHATRRNERIAKQRERLERIADLIRTTMDYSLALSKCFTHHQIEQMLPPSEARQIVMLARLHFPALIEAADRYEWSFIELWQKVTQLTAENEDFDPPVVFKFEGAKKVDVKHVFELAAKTDPTLNTLIKAPYQYRLKLDIALKEEIEKFAHL